MMTLKHSLFSLVKEQNASPLAWMLFGLGQWSVHALRVYMSKHSA